MPLLQQGASEEEMPEEEMPEDEANEQEEPGETEGAMMPNQAQLESNDDTLTVTPDNITQEIFNNADEDLKHDITLIVKAGMELLFDEKSHKMIFDSIRPNDQVPLADELGGCATNSMAQMYDTRIKQNTPMPEAAIVPAGVILIAAVCEHVNEVGLDKATDATFADAVEMFIYAMQDKFDPEFRQKNGLPPSPPQQQMAQAEQGEQVPQGEEAAQAIGPGAQAAPGLLQGV